MRDAACAVICYDITQHDTFHNLQRWVDKVQQQATTHCSLILVGTKHDLVEADPALRRVDVQEAARYGESIHASVVEVSAKTGVGVGEAFTAVTRVCVERMIREGQADVRPARGGIRAQAPAAQQQQRCCG